MIIVGIDPGNVSGMAWWDLEKEAPTQWLEEPSATVGNALREWLDYFVPTHAEVVLSVEKYTMTPGVKTAQPAALMVMGVLEDIAQLRGIELHYHLPSSTKKMVSNTLLRKLGWWTPTKDGHVNDALRLVLCELAAVDPQRYADLVGL